MADPSPLFVLTLMTWVFKKESFCTLITNSFLSQNTCSPSLTLLLPFSQPYPLSPTKLSHHVSSEKSKFFSSKGKTVASDSPAVPKEVECSNSKRSTEEETECDPDSECAPLIDPWYEINPHFPKVPGEYVPPPPGRVLITLVR